MADFQVTMAWRGDLKGLANAAHLAIAGGAREAAEIQAARAKVEFRQPIRAVLGDRVANAVRVDIYPRSAAQRTHAPTVYVWTKAPAIISAFSQGATIRNRSGFWLAIPTENVPRRRGRRMTPVEVEAQFNQDLIVFSGRGGQMLGFVDVVAAKSGKGFRKATRQRQKDGREKQLVLMFVFVRQVTLTKRINWDGIAADLGKGWLELFGGKIADRLNAL